MRLEVKMGGEERRQDLPSEDPWSESDMFIIWLLGQKAEKAERRLS